MALWTCLQNPLTSYHRLLVKQLFWKSHVKNLLDKLHGDKLRITRRKVFLTLARKLKVIPMRGIPFSNEFNIASYDIISPQSWELNTATNVLQEQGVLGNVITKTLPIKERSYSINWIGPKKEINKIINYRSEEHTSELQSRGHLIF